MPDDRDLTGVRWSGLVSSRCARRVYYEHNGQAHDEPDERTRRMWARGRRYEQIIADEVLDELAANGVVAERQAVLEWPSPAHPIGRTHLDILAPVGDSIRIVEIKSNAGAHLLENAALQLAGQAILVADQTSIEPNGSPLAHDVDAFVVAVDSHTGERRDHRIEWTEYQGLVELLWRLAADAIAAEQLPDRVAERPSDARCMFCPFKATCWDGWEPPDIDQVIGLDDVADELAQLDADLKLHGERAKKLLERRDQLREKLRPHLPVNELVGVGKVLIKLTVFDVTTMALGEARTAGLALPAEFDPYVTTSPREKWTVKP
jgi:hypothetical protein